MGLDHYIMLRNINIISLVIYRKIITGWLAGWLAQQALWSVLAQSIYIHKLNARN